MGGNMKKDLYIPALIGLGIYAQNCEMSLANNTTMLLTLYLLLQDHQEIEELECKVQKLEHRNCRDGYHESHDSCRHSECGCHEHNHDCHCF